MIPNRAWRWGAWAMVAVGVVCVLLGVLAATGGSSRIEHVVKLDVAPIVAGQDAYRRVRGLSYADYRPVWGSLLIVAGVIPLCAGISVLHRESLARRQG